MLYPVKMPWIMKKIAPSLIYRINTEDKNIYLTFDDGPFDETTPEILSILKSYNAKATFFCLGKNVKLYPELYHSLLENGHTTGIHGYEHLNGWKTKNREYYRDIEKASLLIDSVLFRPPYGKIRPDQIRHLKKKYKIIMWDVLSGDFDPATSIERCKNNVLNNVSPGSIVVMHDSLKAKEKVLGILPEILKELSKRGYRFKVLPPR